MLNVIAVGCGGFLGAALRYLTSLGVQQIAKGSFFPYGTFIVNVLGCFLIGILGGMIENKTVLSETMKMFIFIGILGGFTTFSTFAYETLGLYRGGQTILALINAILQVSACLSATWIGLHIARLT